MLFEDLMKKNNKDVKGCELQWDLNNYFKAVCLHSIRQCIIVFLNCAHQPLIACYGASTLLILKAIIDHYNLVGIMIPINSFYMGLP